LPTSADELRLSRAQVAFEIARPFALATAYVVSAAIECWLVAVPLALACFLASFVLLHDTMHNALRLERGTNDRLITLAGLLLLKSGHGLRVTHLRHHGRPLEPDDPEGQVVRWSLPRVLLAGPFHILGSRVVAMRISKATRALQIRETIATVLVLALAFGLDFATGTRVALVYWAVAATLSGTMALWAAYIPHTLSSRHPLVRAASSLSRWWTPVLNSFAFHHLHHEYPRIPTALLPRLAREVGDDIAFADETLHPRPVT